LSREWKRDGVTNGETGELREDVVAEQARTRQRDWNEVDGEN